LARRNIQFLTVVIGISIVLFAFIWILLPVIYNNSLLDRYAGEVTRNLQKHNIPIVHSTKRLGVLHCCSNHMDMEISVVVASTQTARELSEILAKTSIISPFSRDNYFTLYQNIAGEALFYQGERFKEAFEELEDAREKARITQLMHTYRSDYVVVYFDQTYSGFSMLDFRAH